jgi:hypothetical protein
VFVSSDDANRKGINFTALDHHMLFYLFTTRLICSMNLFLYPVLLNRSLLFYLTEKECGRVVAGWKKKSDGRNATKEIGPTHQRREEAFYIVGYKQICLSSVGNPENDPFGVDLSTRI